MSRKLEDYTFHPGRTFQLDFDQLGSEKCLLIALTDKQVNTLLAMSQVFLPYHWVWGLRSPRKSWSDDERLQWETIENFRGDMEDALMSGCDLEELVKSQKLLTAALLGQEIDLSEPIPDEVDFKIDAEYPGIAPLLHQIAEQNREYTLDEIFADLETSPISELADLAEVLTFVRELLPTFSIRMPIGEWIKALSEWRYRTGVTNLLYDIALSQRAQAVAQGGTDAAAIFDELGDILDGLLAVGTSAVSGPFTGAATWLWLKVKPASVDGWSDWLASLTSILFGSIRGALYDIEEEISEIDCSCEPNITVNPPNVSVTVPPSGGGSGTSFEQDPADPAGDPPPGSSDPDPIIVDRKCRAANLIVDELITLLETIGETQSSILAWYSVELRIAMIAEAIDSEDSLLGKMILGVSGALQDIAYSLLNAVGILDIDQIVLDLTGIKDDLICAIYNAGTPAIAYTDFFQVLSDNGFTTLEQEFVNRYLPTDAWNLLWFSRPELGSEAILSIYPATNDCSCLSGDCAGVAIDEIVNGDYRIDSHEGVSYLVFILDEIINGTWGNYYTAKLTFTQNVWLAFDKDLSSIVETGNSSYPYEVSIDQPVNHHYTLGNAALQNGDWLPAATAIRCRTHPGTSGLEAWFRCSLVDPNL